MDNKLFTYIVVGVLVIVGVSYIGSKLHLGTNDTPNQKQSTQTITGENIPFERLTSGYYAGFAADTNMVITNEDDWTNLWNQLYQSVTPKPALPVVDFTKNKIIAVFKGVSKNADYSTKISNIIEGDTIVLVQIENTFPGKTCPKDQNRLIGQPYDIVKVSKHSKPVEFSSTDVTSECR